MAKLSVADVQKFKVMLNDLKEAFRKKREEAKGSRERMKNLAAKCVQLTTKLKSARLLGVQALNPRWLPRRSLLWPQPKLHGGRTSHCLPFQHDMLEG